MLLALRSLLRRCRADSGFYLLAVACLAVGIGATIAVFTVVDASLLKPLAYPRAEELAALSATLGTDQRYYISPANYIEMRDRNTAFRSLAAVDRHDVDLTGDGDPVRLNGVRATPDLFATLETVPLAGRALAAGDVDAAVAVIGEGLWRQRFGGDRAIVGRTVALDGLAVEIVGVIAAATAFPPDIEIWLPYRPEGAAPSEKHGGSLQVIGRLAPGRTLLDAAADLRRIDDHLQRLYPTNNGGRFTEVTNLRDPAVRDARQTLVLLMVAVGAFLLVACANVAALMTVRASREARRVALLTALGATRMQVAGAAIAEGIVLAAVSGAAGTALAASVQPTLAMSVAALPPGVTPSIGDPRVIAATLATCLLTALVFSLAPALLAARVDPATALHAGARGAVSRREGRFHGFVIALQATLGMLLVLAAAGSVEQLVRLTGTDPGFDAEGVLTVRVPVSERQYPSFDQRVAFYYNIGASLRSIPGIDAAGATDVLPVGDQGASWAYSVEGQPPDDPAQFQVARGRLVVPGYFEALGIPLVAGRAFTERDRLDAVPVAIVSRYMAEHHWPGEDPLGKRIKRRTYDSEFPWITVVGVVEDVRDGGTDVAIGSTLYLPYAQHDTRLAREMSFVVRSARPTADLAPEIRARIRTIDDRVPIVRVATMVSLLDDSIAAADTSGRVLTGFALAGLFLLASGLYGVVARTVHARRREVGTRMAMGARPIQIVYVVLRTGGAALLAGIALGFAIVPLVTRVWSALLGETLQVPSWAYPAAVLLTLVAAGIACVRPALRAAAIDPMAVLRAE